MEGCWFLEDLAGFADLRSGEPAFSAIPRRFSPLSHDVQFIRKLATKVIHVNDGKVTSYLGTYDDFLKKVGALE
jgi:hypothetical protein